MDARVLPAEPIMGRLLSNELVAIDRSPSVADPTADSRGVVNIVRV
jgi:hypothetical protein